MNLATPHKLSLLSLHVVLEALVYLGGGAYAGWLEDRDEAFYSLTRAAASSVPFEQTILQA